MDARFKAGDIIFIDTYEGLFEILEVIEKKEYALSKLPTDNMLWSDYIPWYFNVRYIDSDARLATRVEILLLSE